MWNYSWVVLLALMTMGCATHTATSGRVVIRDDLTAADVRFSDRDRTAIEQYYRSAKLRKAPPGLAKRDTLPSGLARRDILPSGIQGSALPLDLETRLSVLPAARTRVIIGRDIVLMQRNTRVVLDILYGVVD